MFQRVINLIFTLFFLVWALFSWLHGFRIPFFTNYPGSLYLYTFAVFFIFAPAMLLYLVYKAVLGIRSRHQKDYLSFIAFGFAIASIIAYLILLKVGVFRFA